MKCPYCNGRGYLNAGEGCMLTYPCGDCGGTGCIEYCGECDGYYFGDFCENCYDRCEGCYDVFLLDELEDGLCADCLAEYLKEKENERNG